MSSLSICIPTVDGRANTLADALESIAGQLDPDLRERVEVCISDAASSDGTEAVVAGFQRRGLPITYHRHATDPGLTANILASAERARGSHLWLFSCDDALAPIALRHALALLDAHPNAVGLSLGRANLDRELSAEVDLDPDSIAPAGWHEPAVFTSAGSITAACGMLQTYLSSHIVRRDDWEAAVAARGAWAEAHSRHFPHLWLFGEMARRRPEWVWYPVKLVHNRTGNSLLAASVGGSGVRWTLAVLPELRAIWGTLEGRRSKAYAELLERMRRTWAAPQLVLAQKAEPGHGLADDVAMAVGYTRAFARLPRFWRETAPRLAVPSPVVRRKRRRRQGAARSGSTRPPEDHDAPVTVPAPDGLEARRNYSLRCVVRNGTTAVLRSNAVPPVRLAYRWQHADGRLLLDGPRFPLAGPLRPAASQAVDVTLSTPLGAGSYRLHVGLVEEGVRWFDGGWERDYEVTEPEPWG